MRNTELDFSLPALRYAVEMCQEYPMYSVGVVFDPSNSLALAKKKSCQKLMANYVDAVKLERFGGSERGFGITFKNGSYICCITPESTARHYRFHLMIFEPTIGKKERSTAIRKWLNGR